MPWKSHRDFSWEKRKLDGRIPRSLNLLASPCPARSACTCHHRSTVLRSSVQNTTAPPTLFQLSRSPQLYRKHARINIRCTTGSTILLIYMAQEISLDKPNREYPHRRNAVNTTTYFFYKRGERSGRSNSTLTGLSDRVPQENTQVQLITLHPCRVVQVDLLPQAT